MFLIIDIGVGLINGVKVWFEWGCVCFVNGVRESFELMIKDFIFCFCDW